MSSLPARCKEILYRALAEPIGIALQASNRERVRQALYKARADAGDPALVILQIRVSPFEGSNLIICKSGTLALPVPVEAKPSE